LLFFDLFFVVHPYLEIFLPMLLVTLFFNKMLEKLDFDGVIRLFDEVMILPETLIGLLC